jgi:hypothetical protein
MTRKKKRLGLLLLLDIAVWYQEMEARGQVTYNLVNPTMMYYQVDYSK